MFMIIFVEVGVRDKDRKDYGRDGLWSPGIKLEDLKSQTEMKKSTTARVKTPCAANGCASV